MKQKRRVVHRPLAAFILNYFYLPISHHLTTAFVAFLAALTT